MASNTSKKLQMLMTDIPGKVVVPKHLGVNLLDFTEWALPYVILKDEQEDVNVGKCSGLVRV